ncbi:MAG TPA: 4-hydroxybenzoate 3-monooxygenase [Beutenbergiaceae bacterium]|nr:4-hydroxybenzoate 3-monooxygenase [Beutenbergiaceae bacterium]
MTRLDTQVVIVGAGPAGLLLAHLLDQGGIESIVVDSRSRAEIEQTIRAGILEHGTVEVLDSLGDFSRARTAGDRHDGIELRFEGEGHRIDFPGLTGKSVWLYPQHEVLIDLIAARLSAGQDIRFGVKVERADDVETAHPTVVGTGPDGHPMQITGEFVVGADGSHSVVRNVVTGPRGHSGYFHEYPFAWFGILTRAPKSSSELIYSNSPHGFALISQRSEDVQRMYFQCDPNTDPDSFSEEQLWEIMQMRVPGTELREGPIFQRDVLPFRSFVAYQLRRGRAAIVGDAAHTVPPTGAKGMNLAVADVILLNEALQGLLNDNDQRGIDAFAQAASDRIWKAQHFSWWMTQMLHRFPHGDEFDHKRQIGELRSVVDSQAGRTYLAEAYTGWPFATHLANNSV